MNSLEALARRAGSFASGPWGTHVAFGMIAFWLVSAAVIGWATAYDFVEEIVTMSSFVLLFLLQRAQAKDTLAMQIKLDELLAAVDRASPRLINLEDYSEEDILAVRDRIRQLREHGAGARSIDDILESELPLPEEPDLVEG